MHLSPDQIVYWQHGWLKLNATIVMTWIVMAVLTLTAWLITRRLSTGVRISRGQNCLEAIVDTMRRQLSEIGLAKPGRYLPFLGTLFLFIAAANLLDVVPGYHAPTGSLSTTAALALLVCLAVPLFGIGELGVTAYLKRYVRPNFLLLPVNLVSEASRTLALAVRLFGNMMSGAMIAALLLGIIPLVFPVLMDVLGLLTGLVQAYIFAVLATVYVAAGMRTSEG